MRVGNKETEESKLQDKSAEIGPNLYLSQDPMQSKAKEMKVIITNFYILKRF